MKIILFILSLISIFPLFGEDLFTPKINHGELTRLDVNSIASTLGITEDDVLAHPPEIDGFGPIDTYDEYRSQIYVDSMIPRGFFKQEVKEENLTFYRIVYEVNRTNGLDYWTTTYQRIYYQDKKTGKISLSYEDYMNFLIIGRQLSTPEIQKGVMLIIRNGNYDGVMIYRLWNEKIYEMEGPPRYNLDKKHEAFVYFFRDGEKTAVPGKGFKPDITITASNPLLDGDDIFKYTIQNAFDQNPATSYVEDTEDDLMEVNFNWGEDFLYRPAISLQRKIINGYAKNEILYFQNNRIKEISLYKGEIFKFYDKSMDYQYPPQNTSSGLNVISVYKGSKYSDTCLAEYNLLIDNKIWLFGGYNE